MVFPRRRLLYIGPFEAVLETSPRVFPLRKMGGRKSPGHEVGCGVELHYGTVLEIHHFYIDHNAPCPPPTPRPPPPPKKKNAQPLSSISSWSDRNTQEKLRTMSQFCYRYKALIVVREKLDQEK